jgi:hypothetical protein
MSALRADITMDKVESEEVLTKGASQNDPSFGNSNG